MDISRIRVAHPPRRTVGLPINPTIPPQADGAPWNRFLGREGVCMKISPNEPILLDYGERDEVMGDFRRGAPRVRPSGWHVLTKLGRVVYIVTSPQMLDPGTPRRICDLRRGDKSSGWGTLESFLGERGACI